MAKINPLDIDRVLTRIGSIADHHPYCVASRRHSHFPFLMGKEMAEGVLDTPLPSLAGLSRVVTTPAVSRAIRTAAKILARVRHVAFGNGRAGRLEIDSHRA